MKESKEYQELRRICSEYYLSKIPRRFKRVCKKFPELINGYSTTALSLVGFHDECLTIYLEKPVKVHRHELSSTVAIKKGSVCIENPLLAEKISILVRSILLAEKDKKREETDTNEDTDLFSMKSNEEKMRELLLTLKSKIESLVGN